MARPRKDYAGERRTAPLSLHLTPSERAELERRAASVGRKVSDFVRIVALSDLKKPAPSARDPGAIRELSVEIRRVGNNLNQLAHIANERRALPSEKALQGAIAEFLQTLEKVRAL